MTHSMGIIFGYITGGHENRMRDIQLHTTNDGDVSIIVTLDKKGGYYYSNKKFSLRITLDGQVAEYPVTQHCSLVNFRIENPKLWWPNGWNYPWKTDVRTEVTETEENGEFVYHITLWANEFARCLFVDTPNNEKVRFSNNYFDIEKGFRGDIVLRSNEKIAISDIVVKTFADEWKE